MGTFDATFVPVPEPATWTLIVLSVLAAAYAVTEFLRQIFRVTGWDPHKAASGGSGDDAIRQNQSRLSSSSRPLESTR